MSSKVWPLPDPRVEALPAGGKHSRIGISLQCIVRHLREVERAREVADVQADVGAAQCEIGAEPRDPVEQRAEPPDVPEVARGPEVVAALLSHERSRRVRDGALGQLIEMRLLDQPERFDHPSLRVSPIVRLGGREGQIAETEDPHVGELGSIARQRERLAERIDRLLRPAQEHVRRPPRATGAEHPSGPACFSAA